MDERPAFGLMGPIGLSAIPDQPLEVRAYRLAFFPDGTASDEAVVLHRDGVNTFHVPLSYWNEGDIDLRLVRVHPNDTFDAWYPLRDGHADSA